MVSNESYTPLTKNEPISKFKGSDPADLLSVRLV